MISIVLAFRIPSERGGTTLCVVPLILGRDGARSSIVCQFVIVTVTLADRGNL
jgi:hypothetical protein